MTYVWDAENRLIRVLPKAATPTDGDRKVEYTYDYMNRRVERKVFDWDPELGENGDWESTPSEHTRYVYHGWNVILELDALDSNAILKKYTWGLDLAGQNGQDDVAQPPSAVSVAQSPSAVSVAQSPSAVTDPLQGAGGIGGLLACLDTAGTPSTADDRTFVYSYDANGNVTQLVETTTGGNYGTLQAAYEYDAYGNTIVASGGYADDNLIRFSTRPVDPLTLLGHWPMRVLNFERGRWTRRDPVAERGGWNLYQHADNDPAGRLESFGLQAEPMSCCFARGVPPLRVISPAAPMSLPAAGGVCAALSTCAPFVGVICSSPEPGLAPFGTHSVVDPVPELLPYGKYSASGCKQLNDEYHALEVEEFCGSEKPGSGWCDDPRPFCQRILEKLRRAYEAWHKRDEWNRHCFGRDAMWHNGVYSGSEYWTSWQNHISQLNNRWKSAATCANVYLKYCDGVLDSTEFQQLLDELTTPFWQQPLQPHLPGVNE